MTNYIQYRYLGVMFNASGSFSDAKELYKREKYVIHPEKSTIIMRIPKKSTRF
jgi:hypothetical protein